MKQAIKNFWTALIIVSLLILAYSAGHFYCWWFNYLDYCFTLDPEYQAVMYTTK